MFQLTWRTRVYFRRAGWRRISHATSSFMPQWTATTLESLQQRVPSVESITRLIQNCKSSNSLHLIRQLYVAICSRGLDTHQYLGSHLVLLFVECCSLPYAQQVFYRLACRNEYSWTSIISGYVGSENFLHALVLYRDMQQDRVQPNKYTFVPLLKACIRLKAAERGHELHADIVKLGLDSDLFIGNALVDMYGKCGSATDAQEVFGKLTIRDVVSWNALLEAYTEHNSTQANEECFLVSDYRELHKSLLLFEKMQEDSVHPDGYTFVAVLKACTGLNDMETGQRVHVEIVLKGLENQLFVGNTLLNMYAKCGLLADAQHIFDKLSVRDTVTWTALLVGYAEHEFGKEAIGCFRQMQLWGVSLDKVVFPCSLQACGLTGALLAGHEIHSEIIIRGLEKHLSMANTLIDMYGKCGSLAEGRDVFERLPVRSVVSWTAMIKAYGENHEGNMAIQCFEDMQEQGVKPNAITFTCILAACSHASLVNKGQEVFELMREEHGVEPTEDHYACMVDLLARSGNIYEAKRLAEGMQPPSENVLMALLTGCKIYGEMEVGQKCFQQLVQLNEEDAAPYILMSEIFKIAGMWSDANQLESSMTEKACKHIARLEV